VKVDPMNIGEVEVEPTVAQSSLLSGHTRWRSHILEALFLGTALGMLAFGYRTPAMRTFSLLFSSIVLEALPFMLMGSFIGGLVETFVSRDRMASILPRRRWLAVLAAAGVGMVFPICECAVVPVVRRLARKGLPMSAAVAYLLGAPIANPIVAASTAVAYRFNWLVVGSRIVIGYGIAVTIGLLMGRLFQGREVFHHSIHGEKADAPSEGCACAGSSEGEHHHGDAETLDNHSHGRRSHLWQRVAESLRHAADDFVGVGQYFVIGAFIAAMAQTFIDRNQLLRFTSRPLVAILLMMLLAMALNLCSEADAFVASSFRGLMPVSAQMAFLLLGPILDLKLLLMYQTLFRRRVIAALAVMMVVLVLAAALWLHASGRFSW
jgi:uncharacterized protein